MYDLTEDTELKPIHIDELREFAVRDPDLLQPGDEVLFVHLPILADPSLEWSAQSAWAEKGTVREITDRSQRELHPTAPGYSGDTDQNLVILYSREDSEKEQYRYAADSGVVGYAGRSTGFNRTNFTVRLAELDGRGLEFIDGLTPDFATKLEEFNRKIKELGNSWDDYGYYDETEDQY